jgi:hypothetical protein
MVLLDDVPVDMSAALCADDVEGYVVLMVYEETRGTSGGRRLRMDKAGNPVRITKHGRVDIVMEVH